MRPVQLGSISTGTLRTEDLLDALIREAEYLFGADYIETHKDSNDPIVKPLIAAKAVTDYDDAGFILDELIDALNEYAPPHVSLGMHPGDGADLGWWGGDFDGCDTVNIYPIAEGMFSSQHTFVDTECQLFVEINDHGNTTVKQLRGWPHPFGGDVIWASV
jgi:hypothetical protein